jgi:hypothetical protein
MSRECGCHHGRPYKGTLASRQNATLHVWGTTSRPAVHTALGDEVLTW